MVVWSVVRCVIGVALLLTSACAGDRRGGDNAGAGGSAGTWGGIGGSGGAGGAAGNDLHDGGLANDAATPGDASALDDASAWPDASTTVDSGTDAGPLPFTPAYHAFFDADHLPEIELTMTQAAINALNADGSVYQSATLRYGNIVLENVGVRLKGRASYRTFTGKPALKIKLNEFVPGQHLLGLRRVTLNNMVQDATMMRERLGYAVFRAMGVPAPLCNHARLVVNGEYYGLYANVQTLDEIFVREHWSPAPGNLYDITNDEYHIDLERERRTLFNPNPPPQETKFELETNKAVNDTSDLTALINAVSESSNANFLREVEAVMDLDEVLDNGAVQAVISDWDGYFGAQNNYKIYNELSRGRFVMFPWGIDQTFGVQDGNFNKLGYRIDHSNSERPRGLIYTRCAAITACRDRYTAAVARALEVFESLDLEDELDRFLTQSTASIMEDTRRPGTFASHQSAVTDLRTFLRERAARVRSQLP